MRRNACGLAWWQTWEWLFIPHSLEVCALAGIGSASLPPIAKPASPEFWRWALCLSTSVHLIKRRLLLWLLAVALAVGNMGWGWAQTSSIPSLFNTGVNSSMTPLPNGTVGDQHYSLASVPGGTTTILVRTTAGGYPITGYLGDDPYSAWIGPNNDQTIDGSPGLYDYRTTFSLTGFDPSTAKITGKWSSDNDGVRILLNGVDTGNPPTQYEQFSAWAPFSITHGFQPGINTLDFIINNGLYLDGTNSPTALRVEMTGTALQSNPTIPIPSLFNTGVNSSMTPLPNGTVGDQHYSLASVPSGTTTLLVRTTAGGYPITRYLGDDPYSAWIGPNNDPTIDGAPGLYDYRTTFSLTGFDPSTAKITGKWSSDNDGVRILLNGVDTGNPPTQYEQFSAWAPFSITHGFQPGINTLDFIINNGLYLDGTNSPTALRVEMTGTAIQSVPTIATLNCFFDWAENNYPTLFAPAGVPIATEPVYTYRQYSSTNDYLAVSPVDNHVYYLGSDGVMQDEGPASYWLPLAGCQASTSTTSCLLNWAESNYASLFAPAGAATSTFGVYNHRHYSATNANLGVSSLDNHVYYHGGNGESHDEGELSYWLPQAGCE